MDNKAVLKTNGEDGELSSESFGFSILDITKHAARTILSTLNERDRLGIVTFSNTARVSSSPSDQRCTSTNERDFTNRSSKSYYQ